MTPAGELLAAEIRRDGPIPFRRFMEVALYHPEHGYYRRAAERFGRAGDFFTAEQLQPVFGVLIATHIRRVWREMGGPADFQVVELGAGRGEMSEAFAEWRYVPVEVGAAMPERFRGVVFSNEFFDALPVDVLVFTSGGFREQRVGIDGGRMVWVPGEPASPEAESYLRRYGAAPEEGRWYEANLEALRWIERISDALVEGRVLTIDYGFTRTEAVRFPRGTLMSYRRHTALEDVLAAPGTRDLTASTSRPCWNGERSADCGRSGSKA